MATKPAPRPLSDQTQPVRSTIMGKPAPTKATDKPKQVQTVLGGHRGK